MTDEDVKTDGYMTFGAGLVCFSIYTIVLFYIFEDQLAFASSIVAFLLGILFMVLSD